MAATSAPQKSEVDGVFGAVVEARTYRHLLYLALSFPLGLLYFVAITVGLSVGGGLAILFVGLFVIAGTLAVCRAFGRMERRITISLLDARLRPERPATDGLRARLLDPRNWTTLLYLLLRFPIGLAGFVSACVLFSAVLAMAAPILYPVLPYMIASERITQSEPALLISLFGCVLFLLMVHVVNGLAALSRLMAEALL